MKKFLCSLIVLLACLQVCCYAASTTTLKDIAGTKYESSVNNLQRFDVIGGYEDKTFRPNGEVTRAELAKMLMVCLGHTENDAKEASKKFLSFTDVLSNHWAYGYIKLASDQQLINGYEDNTFKPDGKVTYAEATAMVLRALGYENGVKNNGLSWPNNYMTYADDLDLFASIPEFKASSNATRGDVAILLWNALRTGYAEIVAQNNKGLVYGEGEPLITKYLNCIYLENAEIVDVDFSEDGKTADVTFKQKDRTKNVNYEFKSEDVLEMFGNVITLLYDEKNDEIIDLKAENDYRKIESEVTRVTKDKIYIASRTTAYKLPDDDCILLYGIDDISDAIEVILYVDGSTAEYIVAMGASDSDIEIGLVIDDYVEIDDEEYGIEVRPIDNKKGGEEYYLADEDEEAWPAEDDILLYYINEDDLLMILDSVNSGDSDVVSEIEDDYIRIGKKYYDFYDEDDYTVIIVDSSKITTGEMSDVNETEDYAAVMDYNSHYYFVIYPDVERSLVDDDILEAYDNLDFLIEDIEEELEYEDIDELDYTQESFADLMVALRDAKKLTYKSTLSKLEKAYNKLEDAYDNLEEVSGRTEKRIVAAKKDLREFVNNDCEKIIKKEDDYTSKTFDYFYDVYLDAVDILYASDADEDEINDIYDELEYAIDDLEYVD